MQDPAVAAAEAAAVPVLAGVQLMRVSNSSFGGSETFYNFCANGRYRYAYQSIAGGSLMGHSADSGVWRQDGQRVKLQSSKGASELTLRRISPLRVEVNGLAYSLGRSGC